VQGIGISLDPWQLMGFLRHFIASWMQQLQKSFIILLINKTYFPKKS